jgi:hypothetical protein
MVENRVVSDGDPGISASVTFGRKHPAPGAARRHGLTSTQQRDAAGQAAFAGIEGEL